MGRLFEDDIEEIRPVRAREPSGVDDVKMVALELLAELAPAEMAMGIVELIADGYTLNERADFPPYTHLLISGTERGRPSNWYLARLS